jgi:hypothetical protein
MTLYGCGLGIALALAGTLTACGGSSSETPPPLQPDPKGFRYSGVSAVTHETSDAGLPPSTRDSDSDDDDKPRAPARSTWGEAPPRH